MADAVGDEVQRVAALQRTALHHAVATRHEVQPTARARQAGDLALEHQRADGALGGVVGRGHVGSRGEQPQRGPLAQ